MHPDRADVGPALVAGREFFLAHRLYQSHHDGSIASPGFTKLSFPPHWHYDLLRGLEHFAATDAPPDDRYLDALAIQAQRRRVDGTWTAQNNTSARSSSTWNNPASRADGTPFAPSKSNDGTAPEQQAEKTPVVGTFDPGSGRAVARPLEVDGVVA